MNDEITINSTRDNGDIWLEAKEFKMFYGTEDEPKLAPAMVPSPMIVERLGGMRVNYFHTTWGAYTPARGAILVNSEALKRLEQTEVHNEGGVLSFYIYDSEGNSLGSNGGAWIRLYGIYMDKAEPIVGVLYSSEVENYRKIDTPDSFDGMWILHLVDERALRRFYACIKTEQDSKRFMAFNMRDYAGRRFWTSTLKATQQGENTYYELYTYNDILKEVQTVYYSDLSDQEKQSLIKSIDPKTPQSPEIPEGLELKGIPSGLAIDIILQQMDNAFYIVHNKKRTDTGRTKIIYWADDSYVEALGEELADLGSKVRLWGGTTRVYARANMPSKMQAFWEEVRNSGLFSPDPGRKHYYKGKFAVSTEPVTSEAVEGTPADSAIQLIPTNNKFWKERANIQESTDGMAKRSASIYKIPPSRFVFHGWIPSFFDKLGWCRLELSLDNTLPRTSIVWGGETPLAMINSVREYNAHKGEPFATSTISANGIRWEMTKDGSISYKQEPLFFLGKVIKRSVKSNGLGGNHLGLVAPCTGIKVVGFGSNGDEQEDSSGTLDDNWFIDYYKKGASYSREEDDRVVAWMGEESWIEKGDIVMCFYTGMHTPRWLALGLPPVRQENFNCAPPQDCICEDLGSGCGGCQSEADQVTPAKNLPVESYDENK